MPKKQIVSDRFMAPAKLAHDTARAHGLGMEI
jgi:hypothetical protein